MPAHVADSADGVCNCGLAVQVGLHLASKDWRNRSDALAALAALLPALPEVPNGALEELLGSLVARLADSNAKVNAQALQVR
jgi:hypothetical protein